MSTGKKQEEGAHSQALSLKLLGGSSTSIPILQLGGPRDGAGGLLPLSFLEEQGGLLLRPPPAPHTPLEEA